MSQMNSNYTTEPLPLSIYTNNATTNSKTTEILNWCRNKNPTNDRTDKKNREKNSLDPNVMQDF